MPDIDRRTALTATGLAGLGLALPTDTLAQTANSLDARKPGLPLKSGHLHMGTGAGPQEEEQTMFLAEPHEAPDIAVAGPVERAGRQFDMVPKHV